MRRQLVVLVSALLVSISATAIIVHPAAAKTPPSTIYKQLGSSVDTSCCVVQEYPIITVNFTTSVSTQATIFAQVTVYQKDPSCCPGAFAYQLSTMEASTRSEEETRLDMEESVSHCPLSTVSALLPDHTR